MRRLSSLKFLTREVYDIFKVWIACHKDIILTLHAG